MVCHDDSTINIVAIIIIFLFLFFLLLLLLIHHHTSLCENFSHWLLESSLNVNVILIFCQSIKLQLIVRTAKFLQSFTASVNTLCLLCMSVKHWISWNAFFSAYDNVHTASQLRNVVCKQFTSSSWLLVAVLSLAFTLWFSCFIILVVLLSVCCHLAK